MYRPQYSSQENTTEHIDFSLYVMEEEIDLNIITNGTRAHSTIQKENKCYHLQKKKGYSTEQKVKLICRALSNIYRSELVEKSIVNIKLQRTTILQEI